MTKKATSHASLKAETTHQETNHSETEQEYVSKTKGTGTENA